MQVSQVSDKEIIPNEEREAIESKLKQLHAKIPRRDSELDELSKEVKIIFKFH